MFNFTNLVNANNFCFLIFSAVALVFITIFLSTIDSKEKQKLSTLAFSKQSKINTKISSK